MKLAAFFYKRLGLMKRIGIGAMAAMIMVVSAFTSEQHAVQDVDLHDALNKGWVKVKIHGRGGYSGSCMDIQIDNVSGKKLNLVIPATSLFTAEDAAEQNLGVAETQVLALNGKTGNFQLKGYCTEMHDASPDKGSGFLAAHVSDEKLAELLRFIDAKKGYDDDAIQEAIWCVTDGNDLGSVWCDDTTKGNALRRKICSITGNKMVWYHTRNERYVDAQRNIISNPVEVKGDVSFQIDQPTKLKHKIVDAEGKIILESPKEMPLPRKGNYDLEFKITVKGWDKGTYAAIYFTSEGKEVFKKEFVLN